MGLIIKFHFNSNGVIKYIILYLFLLFKLGFYFCENYSSVTSFLLLILLIGYFFHEKAFVPKHGAIFIVCIVFLESVTYILKGFPDVSQYLLDLINLLTALLVVSCIKYEDYTKYFSNIIYAICIVTLCCVVLTAIGLPLYTHFPILTNSKGASSYFIILSSIWTTYEGENRMQGIFWEPGAFQAMIIFAMLIDLYRTLPKKTFLFRTLLFSITIFFTFSTTGYISLILVLGLYIYNKTKQGLVFLSVFGIIAFLIISSLLSSVDGFLYYTMFSKLQQANDALLYGSSNNASSRVESIIYPLRAFIDSPIVGMGVTGQEKLAKELGHSMFTCTPINYFAQYGLLCGLIHLAGFLNLIRIRKKTIIEALLLISVVFITTMSEQFSFNPVFEAFILYGFLRNAKSYHYQHTTG